MLQKKGRRLPAWRGVLSGREAYAQTISELLQKEHGDSHRAIKQLMRQTDASERTVKHWLSAQHGPDTVYFLRLVVSSPVIRAFVLGLIEGPASRQKPDLVDRFSLETAKGAYAAGEAILAPLSRGNRQSDPEDDPDRDPMNDPKTAELNERQHWFLTCLAEGGRCGATEIMSTWKVSMKTARRDIRGLQQANLLVYVGSRRKGRYRRTQDTAKL